MTTADRVLTALRCEQPDRVPVFVYLNPYLEPVGGRDPSYAEVLEACREYADVIYDWHFPLDLLHTAAAPETEVRQLPDGRTERVLHTPSGPVTQISRPDWRGGGVIKRWITEPEDAERLLSIPFVPRRPDVSDFHDTKARLADVAVAQLTFNDPICSVAGHVAEQTMALWTLEERDLVRRLLDTVFERIVGELTYCLEAGMGPVYYFNGPEFAIPPLMSPRDFEEFVVEYDTRLISLVHSYPGTYVIVHSHGRVNRFLEAFASMEPNGLNVLEPPPIGDTILADAKARIGDRVCLIGNIQYDDIARGTPDQIEALVREAMEQGKPGGGFILSPCASPYESPLPRQASEGLIHYLKMGRRYGGY